MKSPSNIAASVRQRLLNIARNDNRPFNELLQYYAMERLLYRLSCSSQAEHFILKGALMLRAWNTPQFRSTMDIDLLGKTNNEASYILAQFEEILKVEVQPDGLVFDLSTLKAETITQDATYKGIRIQFLGELGTARINMQIDIGFGDIVFPDPVKMKLPVMLDFPETQLLCYSRESAIAEKFEAMVTLRILNSRMKDFFDIWLLSRQFDFDSSTLREAIRLTFEQRSRIIPNTIDAFTDTFIQAKQPQWQAFRKRLQQDHIPSSFQEIVSAIKEFLTPIITDLNPKSPTLKNWIAPGPWTE